MADSAQGMVFPLPLPVIISDKPLQTSTLDEQKTQTDLMRNQQGMWHQYLQLFGLNKTEVEQQNNKIVEELKTRNEIDSQRNTKQDQKERKESVMSKLRDKLSKHWDKIKFWKYFPDLFKNIGEIARNSYEKVKGWISDLAEWFWYALVDPSGSLITTVVAMMIPALGSLVNLAINMLSSIIPQIINMVIAALPGVMKALERIILTIVKMAPRFIDAIVKLVPILIKGLVNALPILLKGFIKLFIALFKAVVKLIPILVVGLWDALKGLWKAFQEAWPELKKAIWEGIVSLWDSMKEAWPAVKDAIYKGIKDFWNSITDLFDLKGTDIEKNMKSVSDFFEGMGELLGYIWNDVVKDFKQIYEALGGDEGIIKSFEGFKKAIDDIWESISSFMTDMQPYIEMLVPPLIRLKDTLVKVATITFKGLKWAFDKLMIVIGPVVNIILWLVKTLLKLLIPVFVFVIDLFLDLYDVYIYIMEVVGKVIDKLWDWGEIVVKWFADMWKAVSGWFTDMWDGLTKTFEPMTNFLGNIWDSIVNVVKKGFDNLLGFFSKFFKKAEEEVPKTSAEETTKVVKKVIEENVTTAAETVLPSDGKSGSPKLIGDVDQKDIIDQSMYNKSLKKTGDSLEKGKKGFERFRNTLEKSLNFRTIPLGGLSSTIGATIMSAFRSASEGNKGLVSSMIGDITDSASYKALTKIVDKLTDSFTKFMKWFDDLDIVKAAKEKVKVVSDKINQFSDFFFNPDKKLKFEREKNIFGNYKYAPIGLDTARTQSKLTTEQQKTISDYVAEKFKGVEGANIFEEFLLRKAANEDINAEKFFGGSGTSEDVTEAFGRAAGDIIKAIKESSKPEEAKTKISTIIVQSAGKVSGGRELLGLPP